MWQDHDRSVIAPAGAASGGAYRAGKILLAGENLLDKSEQEMRRIRGRRISMIPEDPQTSLNPVFTVGNQSLKPCVSIVRGGPRR